MTSAQQQLLIDAIAGAMKGVTRPEVVKRQLEHFNRVDPKLGAGIDKGLGT